MYVLKNSPLCIYYMRPNSNKYAELSNKIDTKNTEISNKFDGTKNTKLSNRFDTKNTNI